ncbi:hypothetical protein D3C79_871180 [compost metagenome]
MRIGEQVELGHRRDVAAVEVGTAHDHHFLDPLNDTRLLDQRQGQVGLRAKHGDGNAVGLGRFQGIDQIGDGAALGQPLHGLMHVNARQPFLAMNVLGVDGCAHQGSGRPRIDRHLFAPRPLPGQPRIA